MLATATEAVVIVCSTRMGSAHHISSGVNRQTAVARDLMRSDAEFLIEIPHPDRIDLRNANPGCRLYSNASGPVGDCHRIRSDESRARCTRAPDIFVRPARRMPGGAVGPSRVTASLLSCLDLV